MKTWLPRLMALILACGVALPAAAQDAEPPPPAAAPRAKVVSLGAPQPPSGPSEVRLGGDSVGQPLSVAVNKTQELVLPAEARDIIVGNPDVADVVVRSPTQVFVAGRGTGQTNIQFRDRQGRTIRRVEVDVHLDTDALAEAVRQVLPGEDHLKVAAVGDSVFLSGSVRSDAAVASAKALVRRFVKDDANVVNLLRVGNEQQVLMRVKVAEMQKSVLKELGVSSSLAQQRLGNHTRATLSTTNGNWPLQYGAALSTSPTTGPFAALNVVGIDSLASNFTLLESQGLIKTLVEPNLTAVSGETATMLSGGEFPFPVSAANGQVSVDFKPFGIGLSFTPVVMDAGRISLKLQSEVSAVDKSFSIAVGNNTTVYGLKVRRAGSVVEMPSGGSIMIAGLLQNDITEAMAGFPGLMDVPVLGALFRSTSFQRAESELVVVVSAYAVQPVGGSDLSLPTDGFAPSSDVNRYLFGRLQEIYVRSPERPAAPAALKGPVGYIMH